MTTLPTTTSPDATAPSGSRVKRWLLAAAGVVCVGIGAVGIVVPGLPTTVFLIIASACFVRSCPWLEHKLLRNRFFAPYMRYVDGGAAMPLRARVIAIMLMWVCVAASVALLAQSRHWHVAVAAAIVATAAAGTVFIALYRRSPARL